MFKHVSKILVLALVIAVFLPSYAVMGMENEVNQTKVFVPKELANEDELLEEDFVENESFHETFVFIVFTKITNYQKCSWLGTVIPAVVGIVGPLGKASSAVLSISANPICEYLFENKE